MAKKQSHLLVWVSDAPCGLGDVCWVSVSTDIRGSAIQKGNTDYIDLRSKCDSINLINGTHNDYFMYHTMYTITVLK